MSITAAITDLYGWQPVPTHLYTPIRSEAVNSNSLPCNEPAQQYVATVNPQDIAPLRELHAHVHAQLLIKHSMKFSSMSAWITRTPPFLHPTSAQIIPR